MPTQLQLIEYSVSLLNRYGRVLRGEEVDQTGLGLHRILCDHLERALDIKIITPDQWAAFKTMCEERRVQAAQKAPGDQAQGQGS